MGLLTELRGDVETPYLEYMLHVHVHVVQLGVLVALEYMWCHHEGKSGLD